MVLTCHFHYDRCLNIFRYIILTVTLGGFLILYRFADYSHDELPIDKWDTAMFYILEACIFAGVFIFLSLVDNKIGHWRRTWGLLGCFFSIRIYFEVYAVLFGQDINSKIIAAILFYADFVLILGLLFIFPHRKPKDNQN
jgi:hypothetical protein